MPRAVRRNRPRANARIGNSQQNCALFIEQFQGLALFQTPGVGAKDVGNTVNTGDVIGRGSDDREAVGGDERPCRERVIHIGAGKPVAAYILEPRIGVVDFNELQVSPVRARRGLIHDFGDCHRCFAAAWPQSVVGTQKRVRADGG